MSLSQVSPAAESASPRPYVPAVGALAQAASPFAEPMLRVATGLLLVPHGAQKLFGWFGGYGIEATSQFFAAKLGMPGWMAVAAGAIEFFGGLLLAAGFATRAIAAMVFGIMFVAVFKVHLGAGFFWTDGGIEYPLLWGVAALYFVIRGSGQYSVDAMIGREI